MDWTGILAGIILILSGVGFFVFLQWYNFHRQPKRGGAPTPQAAAQPRTFTEAELAALKADLPKFRYYTDPVATGVLEPSDNVCVSCGESRGVVYVGPVYSQQLEEIHERVCPWCIASGEAARKFDATFCEGGNFAAESVPDEVVDEVMKRTPGYTSWQSDFWLCHCSDACAFHGDATSHDLDAITSDVRASILERYGFDAELWEQMKAAHTGDGNDDPGIYKFVCLHCNKLLLHIDYS